MRAGPGTTKVTAVMLGLAALGNVRTRTMRAFGESEIGAIVDRAAGGGGRRAGSDAPRRDSSAGAGGTSRGRR